MILEELLVEEFGGTSLSDLYKAEERGTEYGPAFSLVDRRPLPPLPVK